MDEQNDIQSRLEQQQEQLRRFEERQQQFEQMATKSFVLKKHLSQQKPIEKDSELLNRIRKIKTLEEDLITLNQTSVFSREYWGAFLRQNSEFIAWTLLNFSSNFLLYPFDTIKTRTQAFNRFQDICHFQTNKVDKMGMYPGLSHKLALVICGDFVRNIMMKIREALMIENKNLQETNLLLRLFGFSIMQEGFVTSLFLPVEIRKINLQMGQRSLNLGSIVNVYTQTLLPAIFRDSLFYFSNTVTFNLLRYQDLYLRALISNQEFIPPQIQYYQDRNERYACMVGSIVFSLIVTNPFDVVVTKMASQREKTYLNPIQCLQFVKKQESISKLFFSGISSRFGFYLIKGSIFFSYSEPVQNLARSALDP